jgi:nucleoside-diphosphate-sugar epimerase
MNGIKQSGASRPTALVSGVTGFLGSHLARELLSRGQRVVAFVKAREGAPPPRQRALEAIETVAGLQDEEVKRLLVIEADLTEPVESLLQRVKAQNVHIDEIWHCAAVFKYQERDRDETFALNVGGTRNMLELAMAFGYDRTPRFFHVSTAYVCGKQGGIVEEVLHETQQFNNCYEASKCEAERLVMDYHAKHGLDAIVFRPSIIVGDSRTGAAGESNTGYYGVVLALYRLRNTLDANLGGRLSGRDMNLRMEGRADTELNMVPVDFVVRAMTLLTESQLNGNRIFHITNETPPTLDTARECLSLDLDVTGFHLVSSRSFDEVPMTAFEKLVRLSIQFQTPYMWTEPRFSTSALRNVITEEELPSPCIDMAMLHRLNRWFFGQLDQKFAVPAEASAAVGDQD